MDPVGRACKCKLAEAEEAVPFELEEVEAEVHMDTAGPVVHGQSLKKYGNLKRQKKF
jgi:hypothetical protein